MTDESVLEQLQARIHYLEKNRSYFQNALEMVMSIDDYKKRRSMNALI